MERQTVTVGAVAAADIFCGFVALWLRKVLNRRRPRNPHPFQKNNCFSGKSNEVTLSLSGFRQRILGIEKAVVSI